MLTNPYYHYLPGFDKFSASQNISGGRSHWPTKLFPTKNTTIIIIKLDNSDFFQIKIMFEI